MSDSFQTLKHVARWEFSRFFKWPDLFKGFLFFLVMGFIGGIAGFWLAGESFEKSVIAVTSYGNFTVDELIVDQIVFEDHTQSDPDSLRKLVEDGELDGILAIHGAKNAELTVISDRYWIALIQEQLNELHKDFKLRYYNIEAGIFESIEEGVTLEKTFIRPPEGSRTDMILAGLAIALVLMTVFMSFAYQFTAITAEKQQRITEQVVSAITPQTWIDGKILGITAIGLTYVIFYGGMGLLTMLITLYFGAPWVGILSGINFYFILIFLTLALLGTLMWNSFMAAVAATIDDPNSSQRGGLMMLPLLCVFFAFFTLINPDTTAITFLGLFPLTSYAVLPARMVLTDVPLWHPVAAIVILLLTTLFFRYVAGRIFAVGMMMYGKEPSVKEMWHWFKKA